MAKLNTKPKVQKERIGLLADKHYIEGTYMDIKDTFNSINHDLEHNVGAIKRLNESQKRAKWFIEKEKTRHILDLIKKSDKLLHEILRITNNSIKR